jgi:hypothetical protein
MRDLLGLIVRRQAGLWTVWRPWLALFGVSGLAGVPLSRIAFRLNVDLGQQLMAQRNYGVHFETGLTAQQGIAFLLCLAVALLVWSWTCGFVLGSLSGRAVWLTWSVFYFMVLDSAWARFVLSGNIILRDPRPLRLLVAASLPLSIATPLFSVAALCGAFLGVRWLVLPLRTAYLLASAITTLTILTTWLSGWYETAHEVWSGVVSRTRSSERDAVSEMKEDPWEPACRSGPQTAVSCCPNGDGGKRYGKGVSTSRHVLVRETNVSEPLPSHGSCHTTRRWLKRAICCSC